jgi:hypothetical protein
MTKWISFKCYLVHIYIPLLRWSKLHSVYNTHRVQYSNISGIQPIEACRKLDDKPYRGNGCFGTDLWIVLNEMVVKEEWRGVGRWGNVWICGMFACCSTICSVVIVNVAVIFFLPPSVLNLLSLYRTLWQQVEIPECTRYVPCGPNINTTRTLTYTFIIAEIKFCKTVWVILPPTWSRGQKSWLQIQRTRDSISSATRFFWELMGLERGPLSLVKITEELLEWKSSGFGLGNRN